MYCSALVHSCSHLMRTCGHMHACHLTHPPRRACSLGTRRKATALDAKQPHSTQSNRIKSAADILANAAAGHAPDSMRRCLRTQREGLTTKAFDKKNKLPMLADPERGYL